MSTFDPRNDLPDEFDGSVRMFPLPDLVMFPHVMQPLHVFEPRYRQMVEAALDDDRLLAMALLKPGWEPRYEGRPPVFPDACLGRIATHYRLEDGRYHLLLHGICRARISRELPPDQAFREVVVKPAWDLYPTAGATRRGDLQRQILDRFRQILPDAAEIRQQLDQLLGGTLPLGALCDVIGYSLDFDRCFKQQLLAEPNVDHRARTLLEQLENYAGTAPKIRGEDTFPPDFSLN